MCPGGEGQHYSSLAMAKDTCGRVRDEAVPRSLVMTDQDTPYAERSFAIEHNTFTRGNEKPNEAWNYSLAISCFGRFFSIFVKKHANSLLL